MNTKYLLILPSFFLSGCPADICGDGVVGKEEACDDGNLDPADGCDNQCIPNACADGFAQTGELCLSPQGSFNLDGNTPNLLKTADIDGDSFPDVVALSPDAQTMSVALNDGRGAFPLNRIAFLGDGIRDVSFGDFDKDGLVDVAAAKPLDQTILLLFGNGDASFDAPIPVDAGVASVFVETADVNNDGNLDIVSDGVDALVSGGQFLSVLLGNGDGTFSAPVRTNVGQGAAQSPFGFALSDLDQNGNLDLVAANPNDDAARTFLGQGDGTFFSLISTPVGDLPELVLFADIDNDTNDDLLTTNRNALTLSIVFGNGAATFQNEKTFSIPDPAKQLFFANTNGDNFPDLIAVGNREIFFLHGEPTLLFEGALPFNPGVIPLSATIADVDQDGIDDLLTTNGTQNASVTPSKVNVFLSRP